MSRILITGASGFIGRGLIARLTTEARAIRAAVRGPQTLPVETVIIGDVGPDADWMQALDGVDAVVHLAARAHVMRTETDALDRFRRVNAAGTARLAAQAEQAGVRRFLYVSSVKAAADSSGASSLVETDRPAPGSPYGISKLEGEHALLGAARSMETVILRPPLVYGPGVRANFRALLRLVDSGLPLPFATTRNRRSLIALDNLVDAIVTALDAPGVKSGTFYIADGPPLSTPDLIRGLAASLGKTALLWPFPAGWMAGAAQAIGRGEAAESLLGSLAIDDAAFRAATGWRPPLGQIEAFDQVAAWHRGNKSI